MSGYYAGALFSSSSGTTVSYSYYDTDTTGQTSDAARTTVLGSINGYNPATGSIGLTTAQLQGGTYSLAALFNGSRSSSQNGTNAWGGGSNGLYPYLKSFFPNGVQAVSGTVFSDAGVTPLASGANGAVPVTVVGVNTVLGTATTGANGYYYVFGQPGTIANGASLVAYTAVNATTGATNAARIASSTYAAGTPAQSGVDVYEPITLLTGATNAATLSASGYNPNTTPTVPNRHVFASLPHRRDPDAGGDERCRFHDRPDARPQHAFDCADDGCQRTADGGGADHRGKRRHARPQRGRRARHRRQHHGAGPRRGGLDRADGHRSRSWAATPPSACSTCPSRKARASASRARTARRVRRSGRLRSTGRLTRSLNALATANATGPDTGPNDVAGIDANSAAGGDGGHYALATNLDGTGTTFGSPLVNGTLSGTFEGLGHTISNLTIADGNDTNVGFIGQNSGTVHDIGLVGGSVSGGNTVGFLVGLNTGIVAASYETGAVNGGNGSYAGGLVGSNGYNDYYGIYGGTIIQSYATGAVTNAFSVGGLVGHNDFNGTIMQAYATGAVSSPSGGEEGGLVGENFGQASDSITQVYATGAVSGYPATGGLVGYSAGFVQNAYWDTLTTGPEQRLRPLWGNSQAAPSPVTPPRSCRARPRSRARSRKAMRSISRPRRPSGPPSAAARTASIPI